MSGTCPTELELYRLADEELPERRAQALRDHADGCAHCRAQLTGHAQLRARIAAPMPGVVASEAAVAAVMARLDDESIPAPLPFRSRTRSFVYALPALAATALAVFFISRPQAPLAPVLAPKPDRLIPRGDHPGEPLALHQQVGVQVYAVGAGAPEKLSSGSKLPAGAGLTATVANLDAKDAAYLLLFAVDAAGQVHWLYPGHTDPTQDPSAIRLDYARTPTPLPETVTLESPARGEMRILSIVSRQALKVSAVDPLPPSELTEEALRARWPDASIGATQVFVTP